MVSAALWVGGQVRLLDLFCGAGGAAMGYKWAGFDEIVGVDRVPQPSYPFEFIEADVTEIFDPSYPSAETSPVDLSTFDLVHASPPCQAYSAITPDKSLHPDLIDATRVVMGQYIAERGSTRHAHTVIENVERAPLLGHIRLCGSMFGLQVQRHRYFELSFPMLSPQCDHRRWIAGRPWTVTGDLHKTDQRHVHSFKPSFEHGKDLMGIEWVRSPHELVEAIPPAYTRFIGEAYLDWLSNTNDGRH